jgi:hypothetical protein
MRDVPLWTGPITLRIMDPAGCGAVDRAHHDKDKGACEHEEHAALKKDGIIVTALLHEIRI